MKNLPALPLPNQTDTGSQPLGDGPCLLRAIISRLRQAAETANPKEQQAAALQHAPPAEPAQLSQLRHIIEESASALECLETTLAEAGSHEHQGLLAQLALARIDLDHTREDERTALHLALHDALTELPNRRYLGTHLRRALQALSGTPPGLALLFIDLDDFKLVNDAHGHANGDELLRIVAARLRHAVRNEDMVCRLGGDEFVLLLPSQLPHEQLVRLAQQLIDTIAAPIELSGASVVVRPSIGIAVCPQDGHTPQALLDKADRAMYAAKRSHCGFAFHGQQALS